MKRCIVVIIVLIISFAFVSQNPYFIITKADVELKIPKNFTKPIYNFKNNELEPKQFVLGRKLFYDPILSKDNSVSCASCHEQFAAFAHIDHRLSHGIYAKIGTRNVPALQNLIWKDAFMWDGSIEHLEMQPITPITNPIEMDETLEHVIFKLKKDSVYALLFKNIYKDSIINSQRLLKALTQFTALMISANSKYDQVMAGKTQFSKQEAEGLKLFRIKCAACHAEPLFTNNRYKTNGLSIDTSLNDLGRGKVTKAKLDDYLFKVPSLRNCERTYPYMHDGRFRSLVDVLNHYAGIHNAAPTQQQELNKIGVLNETEKAHIIRFLKTLTDFEFLHDRRFKNPQESN